MISVKLEEKYTARSWKSKRKKAKNCSIRTVKYVPRWLHDERIPGLPNSSSVPCAPAHLTSAPRISHLCGEKKKPELLSGSTSSSFSSGGSMVKRLPGLLLLWAKSWCSFGSHSPILRETWRVFKEQVTRESGLNSGCLLYTAEVNNKVWNDDLQPCERLMCRGSWLITT